MGAKNSGWALDCKMTSRLRTTQISRYNGSAARLATEKLAFPASLPRFAISGATREVARAGYPTN